VRVVAIALDLLREATQRKWFLLFGIAVTLVLTAMALTLRLDVVDGALAASSLFGQSLHSDIQAADLALRPLFRGVSYTIFYGGIGFGILACADFGPNLLSPGRIEHLLALPIRRWELVVGTFLGVLCLATVGALYGASGVSVILATKTGVWTLRPVIAAVVASMTFSSIYAAMLTTAIFVRSGAVSGAVGGALLIGGIVAGARTSLGALFQPGAGRTLFELATVVLPRISRIAEAAANYASAEATDATSLWRLLLANVAFGAGMLAIGIWRFEGKDY